MTNHLIVARVHASSAWKEVVEHGVGRADWLLKECANARESLTQAGMANVPYELHWNASDAIAELFAASQSVTEHKADMAADFLKRAMDAIDPLIAAETIDRWD